MILLLKYHDLNEEAKVASVAISRDNHSATMMSIIMKISMRQRSSKDDDFNNNEEED